MRFLTLAVHHIYLHLETERCVLLSFHCVNSKQVNRGVEYRLLAPSEMPSPDRDVLLALFRSTCGTNWRRNDNWGKNADLSQWHGVKANNQGRVVELSLSGNNLEGIHRPAFRTRVALLPAGSRRSKVISYPCINWKRTQQYTMLCVLHAVYSWRSGSSYVYSCAVSITIMPFRTGQRGRDSFVFFLKPHSPSLFRSKESFARLPSCPSHPVILPQR